LGVLVNRFNSRSRKVPTIPTDKFADKRRVLLGELGRRVVHNKWELVTAIKAEMRWNDTKL
jgi:hypothetical protein